MARLFAYCARFLVVIVALSHVMIIELKYLGLLGGGLGIKMAWWEDWAWASALQVLQ